MAKPSVERVTSPKPVGLKGGGNEEEGLTGTSAFIGR